MYKVLLVEDEDIIRKGLLFLVDWQSVDCVVVGEASNGEQGLAKIEENRPDIVLVDVCMPGMNGLTMLEKSIQEYRYDAIIVSGNNEFEYARKAIRLGVTEYLLKPVDYNELYDAIRKIIRKRNQNFRLEDDKRQIDAEKKKLGILENGKEEVLQTENRYVGMMLQMIQDKYFSRLSITDVSEESGMSCTYLNGKFKSATGYTFNDYLNRYRMQKAVELLKEKNHKVYEVAEAVGYSDYKYFIKVFHKYVGCSPTRFLE